MLNRILVVAAVGLFVSLKGSAAPAIPADVDWTTKGAVTVVQDQGSPACNNSWAFASAGAIESAISIAHGVLTNLSEQELIDCAAASATSQCGCPQLGQTFSFLSSNGLCTEAAYPYSAQQGTCRSQSCTASPHTIGPTWQQITPGSEAALVNAINLGPIIARLEVGSHGNLLPAYESYSGGVFAPTQFDSTVVQWVLVVGYTPTYFIVKNSLGTAWGASGFLHLARGGNYLGIENFAYRVILGGGSAGAVPSAPCELSDSVPALSHGAVAVLVLLLGLVSRSALRSSRAL